MTISSENRAALAAIVGPGGIKDGTDMASYQVSLDDLPESRPDLVVRPADTEQVAAVLAVCNAAGLAVVPLGGGTGLTGAAIADGGIVLSTERLAAIHGIDVANATMTVGAGCVLATLQDAAAEAGLLFPLSLGAEGSCRIGGNLSTNAGGVGVLRYGNTRELVLGLEVALPDGRVWNGLNALRKDNTGYDIKQLFIGAEGTLGVITAAVLKLFPAPKSKVTAMTGMGNIHAVQELYKRCRAVAEDHLTAFEMLPGPGLQLCVKHFDDAADPFADEHAYHALIELTSPRAEDDLRAGLEEILGEALEDGLIDDAVFAESGAQTAALWAFRERLPDTQALEGGSIKHDVAVPVSRTAEFIAEAIARVEAQMPGARVFPFGHMGDGNIHCNVSQPVGADVTDFYARRDEINRTVHDLVSEMKGSISAEHGIGLLRRDELEHYASGLKLEIMRKIKGALDPRGIMNPGKVVRM